MFRLGIQLDGGVKMGSIRPIVGTHYDTQPGETIEVIAVGTRGIVVEYIDGRVELLDLDCWETLRQGNNHSLETSQAQAV